jgi:hypothetical protein
MNISVAMGRVSNLSPSYSLMLEILSLLLLIFILCRRKVVLTVPNDVAGERLRIIDKK